MTETTKSTKATEYCDPTEKGCCQSRLPWTILIIIGVVLLIFGGYIYRQGQLKLGTTRVSIINGLADDATAQDKVTNFINNTLLEGQQTAEISNFKFKNGLYKFTVSIAGQTVDSYMTADGTVLFASGIDIPAEVATATPKTIAKSDKPTALLFTMSYCPYGNDAESAMKPVVDLLGDSATVEPHYVIYSQYASGLQAKGSDATWEEYCTSEDEAYCSMHGIQELNQNVRELCIYRDQPAKFWPFIEKVNTACTSKNVDTCWEQVAKDAGIDTAQVKTCQADERDALLAIEVELNTQYSIKGSPALVVNGTEHSGGRTAEDYKTAICSAFNTAPDKCNQSLASANATPTTDASCGE